MKTKMLLLVLFVLNISCSVEVSTKSNSKQLNQVINEFNLAFEQVDIATLDKLTTENYIHLNGSNQAITKKEWMIYLKKRKSQLNNGRLHVTKYLFSERQLIHYEKSAFVTGVIVMNGILDGAEFSRKIRVSHFWVKENSQWRRAGFHDVRIP